MCRLLETVCLVDGIPRNLEMHRDRFERSLREVFDCTAPPALERCINPPTPARKGKYRCRIEYGPEVTKVEYFPAPPRRFSSLKLVRDNTIEYQYKWADRRRLTELKASAPGFDEIIIVKKGLITDTTISNLAFFDGRTWYTPETPLLRGTMREKLIAEGFLLPSNLRPGDLSGFVRVCLINALLEAGEACLDTAHIHGL